MVTLHLINIATCTENMLPWPLAKGIFTMLFTNQYWICAGGVIRVPVVKDVWQIEEVTFCTSFKINKTDSYE